MTPEQRRALHNLVRHTLETEEKHHQEALADAGIEPDDNDPYALVALPDFPHIFREALVLKDFIN